MEKILCGVDLGGTKLGVGLMKPDGTMIDSTVVYDHAGKDEAQVVQRIHDVVNELLSKNGLATEDLAGAGVGMPGHLRFRDGVTITCSNFKGFKLKNFPIRRAIQEKLGTRVIVDNDANAQAFAEYHYGAGAGFDTVIFMTISTGIGAGLVLDGKIYRGMTGTAGEVGHTIVNPSSSIVCGCGNKGCLMAQASGSTFPQIVKEKLAQGVTTSLALSASEWDCIDGECLGRGLAEGDELATAVVMENADYVGIGLYNLFQIFNPPVFVLGGGLLNWGPVLSGTDQGKVLLSCPGHAFRSRGDPAGKARTGRRSDGSRGAPPRRRMNKRQRRIIDCLNSSGMTSVRDLARQLDVSAVTIRQDLTFLEDEGFLRRVHGGARLENADDISKRLVINYESKLRIARKAASFVGDNDSILIESGSTNAILVKELGKREGLTIITTRTSS